MSTQLSFFDDFLNLFGISFTHQRLPKFCVVLFHSVLISVGLVLSIHAIWCNNQDLNFNIYFFIDVFQQMSPQVIRVLVVYYAIKKIYLHCEIERNLHKMLQKSETNKNRRKFAINIFVWIVLFAVKIAVLGNNCLIIYNTSQIISGVINVANDFTFVFYIECLTQHSKVIREKAKQGHDVRREIFVNFTVKRQLEERFSNAIFLTLSMYFLLMIVSLYWIFKRIVYNLISEIKLKFSRQLCNK